MPKYGHTISSFGACQLLKAVYIVMTLSAWLSVFENIVQLLLLIYKTDHRYQQKLGIALSHYFAPFFEIFSWTWSYLQSFALVRHTYNLGLIIHLIISSRIDIYCNLICSTNLGTYSYCESKRTLMLWNMTHNKN